MENKALSALSGMARMSPAAIIAVILLPVLVGGVLIAALATPATHLGRITAAIVNDDTPVTINGTSVPVGRQFAASLISSSINPAQALADSEGSPPGASSSARNFTWVLTNGKDAASGLASGSYAAVLTIPSTFSADATSLSGPTANVKQAALQVKTSPSASFIDPALSDAITQEATAILDRQITANYLRNIYAGFNSIHDQVGQASTGASSLASANASLNSGAASLASGTSSLASGLTSLDSGASSLASGMSTLSTQTQGLPAATSQLAAGSSAVAGATGQVASGVDAAVEQFAATVAEVCQKPGPVCDKATSALNVLQSADAAAAALAGGAAAVASGNQQLAAAMPPLVDGIGQANNGAQQVASGADSASSGAAQVNSGAAQLASGAAQADSGATQLAQGLATAVQKIPTYTDTDMSRLSIVAAQPVLAQQDNSPAGAQSVPLFTVVALWIGGMVLALVRRSVPDDRLMTTESSWSMTLRSVGIGAGIGAIQGLLISPIALAGMRAFPSQWVRFAALAILVGAVFAVLNQGLAAALGAFGRAIALFVVAIALVAGISSTVPPIFASLAAALPTAPALGGLRASIVVDPGGIWAAVFGCLLFAVLGIVLVFAGVAARRTVRLYAVGGRARSGSRPLLESGRATMIG